MKRRFIVTTAFTACLALCAAVWPQTEKVGKTPAPSETAAVTAPQPTLQGAEKPVLPVVTEKKETEMPEPKSAPGPIANDNELADMVYVPGFGWIESQGPNQVEYAEDMYENGNKIGIMG